jgi:hypothetical protein
MTIFLASFAKLMGPDLIVIALIFAVLIGIPAMIALPIIFIVDRRSKKPPPLPPSTNLPRDKTDL